jgi:23S rRNA pseudouridine955/2504/2580 synthase/23S rRNA pseudouridine1911/1915/1917 synthase
LVQLLSEQLGEAVHPASRLDVGVSGVVLCAVGTKAQQHVALAKERGLVKRVYLALARGALGTEDAQDPAHRRSLPSHRGVWDSPIKEPRGKAKARGYALRSSPGLEGDPARTRWLAVAQAPAPSPRSSPTTLLRLEPLTGRRHQLRIHAARAGAPLLGDPEYGGPSTLTLASGAIRRIERVALHASCVSLPDLGGRPFEVRAPVPPALRELWSWVGGDDGAWEDAEGAEG